MKKGIFLLLMIFSTAALLPAKAQQALTDLNLPYLVQVPKQVKNAPVVILIHGYESNEQDFFYFKDAFPKNYLVVSVRAPFSIGEEIFQWFLLKEVHTNETTTPKDLAISVGKLKDFIPRLIKKYGADARQVYLCGFSQGAIMSYEIGLTAPELVKGIAPLSGRLIPSIKPLIKNNEALKTLKIFVGHGRLDKGIEYKNATEAVTYLKSIGLNPQLHTYPEMAHTITTEELADVAKWMQQ